MKINLPKENSIEQVLKKIQFGFKNRQNEYLKALMEQKNLNETEIKTIHVLTWQYLLDDQQYRCLLIPFRTITHISYETVALKSMKTDLEHNKSS